ncbi:class I SAM-dependent methyltransferase [Mycobacterium noviomagense]|uniref:Methyltransferase n=1 Tax=Mycobacterium noviomagense TaxID=459858 RepID=A0A7I7PCH6_9MYCO|nr:methyltransferase [Mycobacterium noviomagense]BBY06246.1 hypothetical protein MNVI_15640 [Mycobacterium noviomagense]
MTIHRIWRAFLIAGALMVVAACYLEPALAVAIALLLVLLLCARLAYRGRDRFIPNLYARDISVYDDSYRSFIGRTMSDLRQRRIRGHTLLWEASRLARHCGEHPDELVLDLGVWIGWSTRLISDACNCTVYGFDTFTGLVEDWQVEGQAVIERGSFSVSEPLAQRFMRDTGVTFYDDLPAVLGRKVHFIRGSTYDTLTPFLADHPGVPIRLFHMDLDTYDSCLHALEACKNHFVEGSILVFDEYLVTDGELRAFYDFQSRYELEWQYRAWGLEIMEMNVEMTTARWRRVWYSILRIGLHWLDMPGNYTWAFYRRPFWRFWLGAPIGDILFMLGAAGQRKSVSLEITGLGKLDRGGQRQRQE